MHRSPFTPLLRRAFGLVVAICLVAFTSACATLPPPVPHPYEAALAGTGDTELGSLASASMVSASAGESGFRLLPTGEFAFDARLALARRAERSLDVQYYELKVDSIGLRFLRELRDAARRGVRVRVILDDLRTAGADELLTSFAALPNVELRLFNPLPVRGCTVLQRVLFSLPEFNRINRRMHNKLMVADNRFAVTGGRNIADAYFMRSKSANFIDLDIISAGPVVGQFSDVFDAFWNSPHSYPFPRVVGSVLTREDAVRRFDERVANVAPDLALSTVDPLDQASVESELAAGRLRVTLAEARVLADSPEKIESREDTEAEPGMVMRDTLAAMSAATSEVLVASPYFIPGDIGMKLIEEARNKRLQVVVITNALGATDEPLVHFRYARYRREMLELGVVLREISPNLSRASGNFGDFGKSLGSLHAKVVVIDERRVVVGSLNIDARSARLNTESALLIESPKLAQQIERLVAGDGGESSYLLQLAEDGETIEWVTTGGEGRRKVTADEPDSSWWLRLKMFLLEPFVAENLL